VTPQAIALQRLQRVATVLGPGMVVMLADTDAGSVITAAQSGAQWGYRLLLLQFLLVPLLYIVQELTVRLALHTGLGYGELIRQQLGRAMGYVALATLAISCFGALATEISGLTGAGQALGIAPWETITSVCVLIMAMVLTGSYRSVERAALAIGAFELAFLLVAWHAHPDMHVIRAQLFEMPLRNHDYLYLLAANLGTSVMPWTVFYQQSALIDKGVGPDGLKEARADTLLGAMFCQLITAAVLIAAAALNGSAAGHVLDNVQEIAVAFTHVLGPAAGTWLFVLALSGGALVATIVVCLTVAWALGEVSGKRHSLAAHPLEAPWFYGAFGLMLLGSGLLVGSGVNLVRLMLATGVVNAVLLPVVLGFLFWLAWRALPPAHRLRGGHALAVALLFALTSMLGLYTGIQGAFGS
jgi:Mn2+/Fe2+ NRAMP family transporter